jgi:hypothetical protein
MRFLGTSLFRLLLFLVIDYHLLQDICRETSEKFCCAKLAISIDMPADLAPSFAASPKLNPFNTHLTPDYDQNSTNRHTK